MESDDDAGSFSSFGDAKSHDGGDAEAGADVHQPVQPVSTFNERNAAQEASVTNAAAQTDIVEGDTGDDDVVDDVVYDESLPDGRTFRRRRRSVLEVDELPDDKRDLEAALAFKTEGNRHFGLGDHETAAACYTESLRHLPRGSASDGQVSVGYANRAACHLMRGLLEETVYDCDRALEFNARYGKALARRSTALEKLGKLEEASKGT